MSLIATYKQQFFSCFFWFSMVQGCFANTWGKSVQFKHAYVFQRNAFTIKDTIGSGYRSGWELTRPDTQTHNCCRTRDQMLQHFVLPRSWTPMSPWLWTRHSSKRESSLSGERLLRQKRTWMIWLRWWDAATKEAESLSQASLDDDGLLWLLWRKQTQRKAAENTENTSTTRWKRMEKMTT